MSTKLKKGDVLRLLREGWELGYSAGITGRAWMQRRLCCGGDSHDVLLGSFIALRQSGEVVELPNEDKDAFWLHRYGLKEK